MTSVNEQKLLDAIATANRAKGVATREELDKLERVAITAYRRIAIDSGLDAILLDRAVRDGEKAAQVKSGTTREMLDDAHIDDGEDGRVFSHGALASFLNDLRLGLFRTKAGEAVINAEKSASEGRRSWLMEPVTKPGVATDSDCKECIYIVVITLAAAYDAQTDCGPSASIVYAVAELAFKAAALGVSLNPDTLKARVNASGGKGRKADRLAHQYKQMFRHFRANDRRAATISANKAIDELSATIRG
jgi:hypothetical protein